MSNDADFGPGLATRPPRATREDASPKEANGMIRAYVERAETLREQKKAIEEDLKEVFAEARGNGIDVAALKDVLKIRAQDPDKLSERETLVDLYLRALGEG